MVAKLQRTRRPADECWDTLQQPSEGRIVAGKSLLSDAELQALMAEAEEAAGAIPDLDDGRKAAAPKVLVPVPAGDQKPAATRSRPKQGDAPAPAPKQRLSIAHCRTATISLLRSIPTGLKQCGGFVLGILDRPFSKIPLGLKQVIGTCALVSIGASLIAIFLMPAALPRRDAVTFLRAKVEEMRLEAQQQASGDGEAAEPESAGHH